VSYELERLLAERGKTVLLEQVRAVSNLTTVSYVRQGEALGLGHAVLMARDLVGNEPFAVLLGDDIIDNPIPCTQQMIDVFERHDAPVIAVQQVPRDEISAYGVIDGTVVPSEPRVSRIRDLVEKPQAEEAPSDLAIIGRYILTPDIFPILEQTPRDERGEIQLTNALRALGRQRSLVGYQFEGVRHDAGNKLGFLKATVEFALKRNDLGEAFRAYLRTLDL
jgi:UTP--glucose-1-phosphate uridylyltransferase